MTLGMFLVLAVFALGLAANMTLEADTLHKTAIGIALGYLGHDAWFLARLRQKFTRRNG